MNKPRHRFSADGTPLAAAKTPEAQGSLFTFGEPVPVLTQYDLYYTGLSSYGETYFEPPVDMDMLAKLYRATAHHGSALQVKRNLLKKFFIPHPLLNRQQFEMLAQDFLIFGNCYLETLRSKLGSLLALRPAQARHVRVGVNFQTYYWQVPYSWASPDAGLHAFAPGSVAHLKQSDINQEVYGVPDYIGALQSVLLNESATLFRRRYYENGSHAGFILYMRGADQNKEDVDAIRQSLRDTKGVGNFKNLFVHSPNGEKDGLQLIPVSDVKAGDDFSALKNTSRDDQLAGHRVPPQLLGIVPSNNGGFGDTGTASRVFIDNEIMPLMETFRELNDLLGAEVIQFRDVELNVPVGQSSRRRD
ncbi:phage portal protein [Carnimonas bestiolae]|uniref:phage portal protein n=1 Tax=Carnimonas bestiolae TaxID=3402172 RepID=UPI003EDBA280